MMPSAVKGITNLKAWSLKGDLGKRDDAAMQDAFPHPIKNSGTELSASAAFGSTVAEPGEIGEKE